MAEIRGTGCLLRLTEYGDRDIIAAMLTDTAGRLDILARGAKGSRRFGGHLGLFYVVDFLATSKPNSTLATLKEIRVVRGFGGLSEQLERLAVASVLAECFLKSAMADEVDPDVFHLLVQSFIRLESTDSEQCLATGCHAGLQLLRLRGILADLGYCHRCGLVLTQPNGAGFRIPEMAPFCEPCSPFVKAHVRVSSQALGWLQSCQNRWDGGTLPYPKSDTHRVRDELWTVYESVIQPALSSLVGGRLQSVLFLKQTFNLPM